MIRISRPILALLALPAVFFGAGVLADGDNSADDYVVIVPVSGMIDDGIDVILERAIRDHSDAAAMILRIDTPGGRVDSAVNITNQLMDTDLHTIAFIEGMGAISAGAMISLACNDIVMRPDTNIGAATPVIAGPGGMQPTGEKEVSFMRARMRAMAEANGHNPYIAEAMVDQDIELRGRLDEEGQVVIYAGQRPDRPEPSEATEPGESPSPSLQEIIERVLEDYGDEPGFGAFSRLDGQALRAEFPGDRPRTDDGEYLVLEPGKLLTMTAREARDLGLIEHTAGSVDEVMELFGYEGFRKEEIDFTWSEALFRFLTHPTVSGLLLMIGVGGLYFEVRSPGFGLPGMIGLVALSLFFGARYVIGLSDWIDMLLVAVGLALIAIEIFALPGFGIFGLTGIVSLLVGLYLTLTNVPIPEYSWDFDRLRDAGITMIVAMLSYTVLAVALWQLLPRTRMYTGLVLTDAMNNELGYVITPEFEPDSAIGQEGKALSMLRPAGRGRFGDKTYSVVTRGDYIEAGAPIRIVEVRGNRYVVDPVKKEH